jgi:hypothetical protein
MALNELMQTRTEIVPLIPNTGVQFLDLGFSLVRKDDVPQRWSYFDPGDRARGSRVPPLVARGNEEAEDGTTSSYDLSIKSLVQMFERVWMPLPLLRVQGLGFSHGPTNWARVYLARLAQPDEHGNEYRLVIALDTALMDYVEGDAYLAPSPQDARNTHPFKLPSYAEMQRGQRKGGLRTGEAEPAPVEWFFNEQWVRDWCFETFKEMLERDERSRKRHSFKPLSDEEIYEDYMQGPNEHLARYASFLDLLHSLDIVPKFKLVDRVTEPRTSAIDVDLVLDLGNSRSCGLLIEADPAETKVNIRNAVRLQIRDLGLAEQVYAQPFSSRFEFTRARFGRDHVSSRSGRSGAFAWPTIVRVGPEAVRLSALRSGTEGLSGLSSPKRYLWDKKPQPDSWRVSPSTVQSGESSVAVDGPFTALVNNSGEAIHRIIPEELEREPDKGILSLNAFYARGNLASFALGEIFVQAITMMNSPMHRLRRPVNAELPRRLRRIILTTPTAMSLQERSILKEQAESARDMAYVSMGLASIDYLADGKAIVVYGPDAALNKAEQRSAGPEVALQWDEATATAAVYLYTEIAQNYSGGARTFFDTVRSPENAADPACSDSLRVATLDIGGGTTDLVVISVTAEGQGTNLTLTPFQEFREGFNLAGDDALLRVVREHVIAPIRARLEREGLGDRAGALLEQLLGGDHGEKQAIEYVRRQQFAAQVAAPIALGLLEVYESFDPLSPQPSQQRSFNSFFTNESRPAEDLLEHFNAAVVKRGLTGFRLQDTVFEVSAVHLDLTVRSVFVEMLRSLGEVIHRYRADLLILSGRTSRLPAVRALLEECGGLPTHRVISLHQFRVGSWYPFRDDRATVGDPKTTAAVGAMICHLGSGRLENFNLLSDLLRPRSTARYFGKLSDDGRLLSEDVHFSDLDLDNPGYELPELPEEELLEFHGPMPLGFRQLSVAWWPGTRLYYMDFANREATERLQGKMPLRVRFKRKGGRTVSDPRTGEEWVREPGLDIDAIFDSQGMQVKTQLLCISLQTLDKPRGYWLDTGILLGS